MTAADGAAVSERLLAEQGAPQAPPKLPPLAPPAPAAETGTPTVLAGSPLLDAVEAFVGKYVAFPTPICHREAG